MEADRALVDDFLRLFYAGADATWDDTRWLGVKVRKTPVDLLSLQEIVIETRPDLIVESGVAAGGSTLFFATLLDALGDGEVIAVDSDLSVVDERVREHPRITLVEGDSAGTEAVTRIRAAAEGKRRVMVDLDSDHHAAHVTRELSVLSELVSPGCYLVVEDGVVNGHPIEPSFGAGPTEALRSFLATHPPFSVDDSRERLLLTFNRGGYLRREGELDLDPAPAPASNGAGERATTPAEVKGLEAALAERDAEIASLRESLLAASAQVKELGEAVAPMIETTGLQAGRIAALEEQVSQVHEIARQLAAERHRAEVLQAELDATSLRLERLHARAPMRALGAIQRVPPLSWLRARRARSYHRQLSERRGT